MTAASRSGVASGRITPHPIRLAQGFSHGKEDDMVFAFVKMALVALLVATLLWASVVLYLRSRRREALEARAEAISPAERQSYIRDGMRDHSRTMLRLSVALAWAAVLGFVVGLVWYVNFS